MSLQRTGGPKGPPSPLQWRLQFFVLYYIFLSSNKRKIYGNPPEALWGDGGKAVNKKCSSLIKSPLCDLLCWFRLYLSTKIYPYSIYDILVIICMVIIVQSYIIVNFGYKIVSYKISVIFLDIIFFPLYYSHPPGKP